MGGSSSKEDEVSSEQQEFESLATSTGSLLILQKAFSKLADPLTNSIPLKTLQECFSLNMKDSTNEATLPTDYFPKLLLHLGPSLVDLFFMADKGGIDWIQFLRGYIKCCGRMPLSSSISILYRLYAGTSSKAGYPLNVEFESDDTDCKVKGHFTAADILMILWICWIMSQCSKRSNYSQGKVKIDVPDINNLLLSAVASCTEDVKDLNVWDYSISGAKVQLQAQKVHMWVLSTVPNLAHCFTDYVLARLQRCATLEGNLESSNVLTSDVFFAESPYKHLLTCGTAWAISLTQGSIASREILDASTSELDDGTFENLLYRSSLHGRGLNRFWSNIEGYCGPLLTLVSANPGNADESNRWVIGVLTAHGFENKSEFYGTSGYIYSLSPIFNVFSPHGKEKNFVYSHLHPSGSAYDPHPKPEGIAFGGTVGNGRIFIDEDFARITIRHHAVDKTYKPGSLVPDQGYLPLEAPIMEVEVWGLGGEVARKNRDAFKNREQLFTQQRRKVDLKTFGNWEDSPEKMMMDMVANPNRVQREER